ncbi:TrgA family protein [Oceanicola sp. S124]|uniref:TrgA family protein n=1 Tax=Oceanicola sp. S124 TaxID=1042378 RepID=UPI0002558D89|nr:TrgA family protein [Oceanicola sp. S124]
MFTMGRVTAAAVLGGTGYLVATQVMAVWDEEMRFGYFPWVSLGLGLWAGWQITGRRATRHVGPGLAAAYGLTGMGLMLLAGLFVFCGNEALRKALRRRYDDPMEAILDILPIAADWGANLLHPHIIATLLAGGLMAGGLARAVDRIWK